MISAQGLDRTAGAGVFMLKSARARAEHVGFPHHWLTNTHGRTAASAGSRDRRVILARKSALSTPYRRRPCESGRSRRLPCRTPSPGSQWPSSPARADPVYARCVSHGARTTWETHRGHRRPTRGTPAPCLRARRAPLRRRQKPFLALPAIQHDRLHPGVPGTRQQILGCGRPPCPGRIELPV